MDIKNGKNSVRVVVIDSGICSFHDFGESIIGGIGIDELDGKCTVINNFEDEIGHGTAVVDILLKTAPHVKVFCVKIFDNDIVTSFNKLCYALEYVYENIDCEIIQISGGVTFLEDYKRIKLIINNLVDKKVHIISAFDNDGAISYPAAFENVIGVDTSPDCHKKEEFELIEGNIIDIRGTNTYFRVKWVEPRNIIIKGSSFVTSNIVGLIANYINNHGNYNSKTELLNIFRKSAKKIYSHKNYRTIFYPKQFVKGIKKAIVFPFNKEIHSIAAFSNLLPFEIEDYFDVKYSNNINKKVEQIVSYCSNDKIIKNYTSIDWDSDFDTLICGHCGVLSKTLGFDVLGTLIESCVKHNKRMYAFDHITYYIKDLDIGEIRSFFFPYIDFTHAPQNRFGKLRHSSKPILGVYGTSSQQGKHTLQLYLRQIFKERNYSVGQIGTEPSGYLFGFDSVYPMGHNSSVYVNTSAAVSVLNEMIWSVEQNNPDIILVGSQSGTIPYDFGNISCYTFKQYDFLLGALPDAFILCVNPNDDIDYIRRTIKFIESLSESKNIGIVLFPIKTTVGKTGVNISRKRIDDFELVEITNRLHKELSVKVFNLLSLGNINMLVDEIISYFAKK